MILFVPRSIQADTYFFPQVSSTVFNKPPTKAELIAKATDMAVENHLSVHLVLAVIDCESQWNPHAVSPTHDHGLVQINAPSHSDITIAQMEDVDFSLNYMAEHWKAGHQNEWSCYRMLK